MKMISRRSFLAAAGLSVAALALTACGGSSSSVASSVASSASSEAASTSAAAGELTTVEAGKLTMATNATFPPYEMTTDSGEFEGIDIDTAKAIADATGLPARCEPRLREQCFGKYEGTPRNGGEFRVSKTHFADRYDGGESMMQLAQRIYNLLDELKADTDKTYLLVAHNGIARVVQSYFYDMTNEEYAMAGIKNCELVEYHFE